jgi:DNA-binding response OmpR family regulator
MAVETACDGEKALEMIEEQDYDLIVLDVMMPKMDGWSVLRQIKKDKDIPVLMLTARSEESDEIFGLELGADEYIAKPFSPKILMARIALLLKRYDKIEDSKLIIGPIVLDQKAYKAFLDDELLKLSSTEFKLLEYLMLNKGIALTREQLMKNVWGYEYFDDTRSVDTYIKRLRKSLKEASDYIVTVRGVGYRLEAPHE